MDKELLAEDEFAVLANTLSDELGTRADDKVETNEKVDAYLEEIGDVNFYTCTILLILDPNQEFETYRANLKMFLLPAFQILVPFGMCWYFLVEKDLVTSNGYCSNHANVIFRFTGFVSFMYSAWQIIDGCDDASAKYFFQKAVRQWSRTGRTEDFRASCLFYMGYVSQQLCSFLLLVVTYVIYTSQCDTPLDLLMNCVAINFVLDIDTEWMSDRSQDEAKTSAIWLYKQYRDACIDNGVEIKKSMKHFKSLRSSAPKVVNRICQGGDLVIWVSAYLFVVIWTFCPSSY